MNRSLSEVLDRMLAEVPLSWDEWGLRRRLNWAKTAATHKAPELQSEIWGAVAEILFETFGDTVPTEGWQGKIVRIFQDREEVKPPSLEEEYRLRSRDRGQEKRNSGRRTGMKTIEVLLAEQKELREEMLALMKALDGVDWKRSADRKRLEFQISDVQNDITEVDATIHTMRRARQELELDQLDEELRPKPTPEEVTAKKEGKIEETLQIVEEGLTLFESLADNPRIKAIMTKFVGLGFAAMEESGFIEKSFALAERAPAQKIQLIQNGVTEPAKIS